MVSGIQSKSGAAVTVPSRARHALPLDAGFVPTGQMAALGALVCAERLAHGLSTRALARRASVARSTVQRLERGQLHPRRSCLSAVALGINPDRQKELLARFIEAAGGEDALADDGNWRHYRYRRMARGILAGHVPLPTEVQQAITLHRAADALWQQEVAILDTPGALDDGEALAECLRLGDERRRLREQAGPPMTLHIGKHRISVGMDAP